MERAKVIVHMYVSIDGKIDGPRSSDVSSSYYSNELFRLSNADGNGRKTIAMYATPGKVDLSKYSADGIEYEDWIPNIKSETWSIAFDRKGSCGWEKDYFEYNGHKMHAVEILTKQAPKEYLAFLRSMNIPYIISGKTEFKLEEVLEEVLVKLKKYFQIDNFALCGGAVINGVFLKAHLVDRISLVLSPHINGDNNIKSTFDTMGTYINDTFEISQVKKLGDGGVHLIFDKK